jgi:alkyl hydroperoxide reductase subunit AhpC
MGLRINDTLPNLTVTTDEGTCALHDWQGDNWAILFSHPKDFTPVCTTEFGAVAQLADEWAKRNTKVMGISVDGVAEHKQWKGDIEKFAGAKATFPIIADTDLAVAKAFDMLPSEAYLPDGRTANDTATVRSVFIVAPNKKSSAHHDLSDVGRPEFRRSSARAGCAASLLRRARCHASKLGARSGRNRGAFPQRRSGPREVRRDRHQAPLPPHHQAQGLSVAAAQRTAVLERERRFFLPNATFPAIRRAMFTIATTKRTTKTTAMAGELLVCAVGQPN